MRQPWPGTRPGRASSSSNPSEVSESDETNRYHDRSSSGIFELDPDTPQSTSGSDNDEPSTPLHTHTRRAPPLSIATSMRSRPPSAPQSARAFHRADSGSWSANSPGARSFRSSLHSTTPSFSSPLAMAPTLPGDVTERGVLRSPDGAPRYASASAAHRHKTLPSRTQLHSFSMPRTQSGRRITPPSSMGPPAVPRHAQTAAPSAIRPRPAHRRAHSTTGASDAILCSSPVGGLDGVDPQLVAAIGSYETGSPRVESSFAMDRSHRTLSSEGSGTSEPELALSPPPSDLVHRLDNMYLDSPVASPATRRAEGLRMQRVPRSVALASDVSVPQPKTQRRASRQSSPQPSPTDGAYSQPTVLGLGLGLPSLDVRRSRSVDEGDVSTASTDTYDAERAQLDACVVALSRAYKAKRWRARHVAWQDWTASLPGHVPDRAAKHWSGVRCQLPSLDRNMPSYVRLASGMRVVSSVPSLRSHVEPATPPRHEHDVFGERRGVGETPPSRDARITSDKMHAAAPKAHAGVRRQNTTMSVDDTVAAQRQQLWNEVVQAKSACDAELDKILSAMLAYAEHAAGVNDVSPDTTVMVADDTPFDPFAESTSIQASDASMEPLQAMATIAAELRGMSLHTLLARPALCRPYISEIQGLGSVWDEHPDWHGRGWYVELLLTVAGLSRVLEWWDAEHRFWNSEEQPRAPSRSKWLHGSALSTDGEASSCASPTPHRGSPDPRLAKSEHTQVPSPSGRFVRSPAASLRLSESPARSTPSPSPSTNMLMELSFEDERIVYLSPTWQTAVGTDPAALIDVPIASLLSPRSVNIFSRATKQLREHSWHTVEIVFEIAHLPGAANLPLLMEAQGMLVHNHATKEHSHTMWVVRVAQTTVDEQSMEQPHLASRVGNLPPDPTALNTDLLLCRICEREIPAWFFEKHSEICHEIHRLEMEIAHVNETLLELNESGRSLHARLEAESSAMAAGAQAPLGYRGETLALPPRSSPPSALEGAAAVPLERASRAHCVKNAIHVIEEVLDVLSTGMAISTPAIPDEAPATSLGVLLSPKSEQNIEVLRKWDLHLTDDPALDLLVHDAREAATSKVHAVNRMRNTIVYVETVRMESEQRVAELLGEEAQEHRDTPPVMLNDVEVDEIGTMNGLLFEPLEEAVDTDEDDASDQPSPSGHRSPIPIPNARRLQRSALSPPLSPRVTPADGRFLSIGTSPRLGATPLSPSMVPPAQPKATAASIKDFELLKPISKGAYGSVFLARKRATGDHFAIKVLKKSDMIAKNQITNVRAERMILMNRTQSPFVVKLFFTFQSAEYLYLVMEYLPGGDCASLVKALGELPEAWARQYLAEIVHGLAYLHSTGVVHRDMKPDNLLIDQRGHLKLTDFGLSKFGLLGRQTRARHEEVPAPIPTTWAQLPDAANTPSVEPVPLATAGAHPSEAYFGSMADGAQAKRIVGTPDYLAPETILGVGVDEFGVDWWAVGVILFEFLCGYPPFHATTPDQVFDKILSRSIDWETDVEMSDVARDLVERLICTDRRKRLGANGVDEIKKHPFFDGINWEHLMDEDGPFVPCLDDAASTDYFDPRGAVAQSFDTEADAPQSLPIAPSSGHSRHSGSSGSFAPPNEFGAFSYKNLPVLKQANDEMVRRIRTESTGAPSSPARSATSSMSHQAPVRPVLAHRRALSDLPTSLRSMPRSTPSEAASSPRSELPSSWNSHAGTPPAAVLVADYNPVSQRILLTALEHAGVQATLVEDGAEMCRLAMGETKYAVLFVKLALRVMNGQDVARMIKSTRNVNAQTPIVALTHRDMHPMDATGSVFDAVLPLPASPAQITALLASLHEEEPTASPYVLSPALMGRDTEMPPPLHLDPPPE